LSKFIDELEHDDVPVEVYKVIVGNPYKWDRQAIFSRRANKYTLRLQALPDENIRGLGENLLDTVA